MPDGSKQGLDDFLASGKTVADLIALARPNLPKVEPDEDRDGPYTATDAGLVWNKPTRDGLTTTLLTNFDARIAEDMGAVGLRVEQPGDIAPALAKAIEVKRPVIVDVVTDIDALAPLAVTG